MPQQVDLQAVKTSILAAIHRFHVAVTSAEGEEQDRLAALSVALDGLVQQYNSTANCEPDDDVEAPRIEWPVSYARLGTVFPTLGYYATIDPSDDLEQQPMVGDAIDDIGDIARDLADVIWYFEHDRPCSAIWNCGLATSRIGGRICMI